MKTMRKIKRRMALARAARYRNNASKERYNQFIKDRLNFDSYMHIDGSISYRPYYGLKYDFESGQQKSRAEENFQYKMIMRDNIMKMKEVTITVKLPDGEITLNVKLPDGKKIIDHYMANNNEILCLRLVDERRPMEIFFKEVVGRDYILHGEYYTDSMHHLPQFFVAEDQHFAPKVKITDPSMVVWHLGRV